ISKNKYALIGSVRSIAQIISFEIRLFLIIFIFIILTERFSLKDLEKLQGNNISLFILTSPIYIIFFTRILIELNRTPFDLIEGESELVSGFNVEYYRRFFVLIFLSEYSRIVFIRFIITIFFFNYSINSIIFYIILTFHILIIL
ncbi:NADH-ubiquinone oxidoreductase chain 1, partial [Habropoda laboriosa]